MGRMFDFDAAAVERLCAAARDAAREIMAVYAGAFATTTKADGSPVTEADLRADRVIRAALERDFPGVHIVSEESMPDVAQAGNCFFLVDPLDGTKEFVARTGEFTVNIAAVVDGRPVAGVVLAPALDELFFGGPRLGAWCAIGSDRAHAIEVAPRTQGPLRVVGSRFHAGPRTADWLQRLPLPWEQQTVGSSLKFCRIAQGRADLYLRLGETSQWDTAAGQAVLEAAGGAVLEASGAPLTYGAHRPLINPEFVALADPSLPIPPLA